MSLRNQAGINLPGYNALKVANAPTIGTASQASSTSVSVAFTAPSCVGGGAITSYTAFACCGVKTGTAASSPVTVTGLTTGQSYTFKVFATNAYGPSYPSANSNSVTLVPQGQQAYITAGTYSWVAPACVTSVSVVAVGGGGGTMWYSGKSGGAGCYGGGGGGGGLRYYNNYSVTPGNSYTVVVGAGGTPGSTSTVANGGNSSFHSVLTANGGTKGRTCAQSPGGTGTATGGSIGGGNGGAGAYGGGGGSYGGGGGAGGYSGNGASAAYSSGSATASAGGAGGAGFSSGGGVGLLGQGTSGANCFGGGKGGSNGQNGYNYYGNTPTSLNSTGGNYGGGAGAMDNNATFPGGTGGVGAVRIIWPGTTRSFPSTNTGDL